MGMMFYSFFYYQVEETKMLAVNDKCLRVVNDEL